MKFTLSWLKEFLDTSASLSEITAALDGIGLEVAETIDRSVGLEQFEVAHIAKTISHPVAEKLKICEVETKKGILQIVCGAKNARSGLKVVLAPIGSLIPNGNFKIKESEIRTVKSYGMLCSGEELNINKDSEGIIELPDDAVIGEQILKYLSLDDPIICIEITPNRADALGVYGIARDLAARGIGNLKEIKVNEIKGTFKSDFFVDIQEKEYCSIFATRELKNLTNKQSPIWLKKKLEDIKISSISAIVDITNYICYSFGQPMHAYDRSRLGSGMEVKFAGKNSNFKALNNKDYILSTQDLIITDEKIPQSIAGIIGSLHSACSEANDETINIILEAACFSPDIIMEAGRRHNILTDSRYRFERNVDSASTLKFLDIATNMILSICGGETSELIVKGNGERIPKIVELPLDFVSNYTGLEIPEASIVTILTKLGFECMLSSGIITVTVPSWRADVSIKEDLIEEILRIYSYDALPSIAFASNIESRLPKEQRRYSDARRIIASQGYDETINWSFIDKNLAKSFTTIKEELTLVNPISVDLNYMRPSIVPSLLKAASKNLARSIKDLALFEVGPVFGGTSIEDEQMHISGIRAGFDLPKNPHFPNVRAIDVFDIKADLNILLNSFGLDIEKCYFDGAPDYYHKTRSAHLLLGKKSIATFGQLHPKVLKLLGIDKAIYAFELNLSNIPQGKNKFGRRDKFLSSDFQSVSRDFAFIVDKDQPVGEIVKYIGSVDKKLIKSVDLFDIYIGNNIENNTKSVALSVHIQAEDRTLNEKDLEMLSQLIISGMGQKFGGRLRI